MQKRIFSFAIMLMAGVSILMAQNAIQRETEVYSIKGKDTLKVDVYVNPQTEVKAEGRPVMIYIHGGGFTVGSRINAAQQVYFHYMANQGWLVAAINYRLAGLQADAEGKVNNPYGVKGNLEAIRMACADAIDATNYLLKQNKWKINPQQIVLAGGSAGAATSLQLEYDWCNGEPYTKALPQGFKYAGVLSQSGTIATPQEQEELVWKSKPCPIMLMHGSNDTMVPLEKEKIVVLDVGEPCNYHGTEYIARQLKEMDVPYWRFISEGADHVIAMLALTRYQEEQYRFLNDFVVGGLQGSVNTIVADKEPANMADANMMIKYVPLYILGYGQYLEDIDWTKVQKPANVVY